MRDLKIVPPTPQERRNLHQSDEIVAAAVALAQAVAEYAVSISPEGDEDKPDSQRYKNSFKVIQEGAEVFVANTAPHAAAVEWLNYGAGYGVLGASADWANGDG